MPFAENELRLLTNLLRVMNECVSAEEASYSALEDNTYELAERVRRLIRAAHPNRFSGASRPYPPLCCGWYWGKNIWDWVYWAARMNAGWLVGWGFSVSQPTPNEDRNVQVCAFVGLGSDTGDQNDRVLPHLERDVLEEYERRGWIPKTGQDWLHKDRDAQTFAGQPRGFEAELVSWLLSGIDEAVQILAIAERHP